MHPQLVAGAWVGFNDNRVTMQGDWGQGAHNALNIVGDFFQQSLKSRRIDANLRFAAPPQQGMLDPLGRMNDWLSNLFQGAPEAQALPQAVPWPEPGPAPERVAPAPLQESGDAQ